MPDYCDLLIEYHNACVELLKITHKYLHQDKLSFDLTPNITIEQLLHKVVELRVEIGNDPVDEMVDAALRVYKAIKMYSDQSKGPLPPMGV